MTLQEHVARALDRLNLENFGWTEEEIESAFLTQPVPSPLSMDVAIIVINEIHRYVLKDGIAALAVADRMSLKKLPGEKDTEFVKRIAAAMIESMKDPEGSLVAVLSDASK